MEWADIIVSKAVVNAQFARDLIGVLGKQVEAVHEDLPHWVAQRQQRREYLSRHEVGQGQNVFIVRSRCAVSIAGEEARAVREVARPRALLAVKVEPAQRAAVVELLELRLPEFAAEPE